MEQKVEPRNIFELINKNVCDLADDVNTMHAKIDALSSKLDGLLEAIASAPSKKKGE